MTRKIPQGTEEKRSSERTFGGEMLIGKGADVLRIQSATEKRGKMARAVRWREKERSRKTEKIRQDKTRQERGQKNKRGRDRDGWIRQRASVHKK